MSTSHAPTPSPRSSTARENHPEPPAREDCPPPLAPLRKEQGHSWPWPFRSAAEPRLLSRRAGRAARSWTGMSLPLRAWRAAGAPSCQQPPPVAPLPRRGCEESLRSEGGLSRRSRICENCKNRNKVVLRTEGMARQQSAVATICHQRCDWASPRSPKMSHHLCDFCASWCASTE